MFEFAMIRMNLFPVHGVEVNKTYLEDNKSDWSIADISTWLHLKSQCHTNTTSDIPLKAIVSIEQCS